MNAEDKVKELLAENKALKKQVKEAKEALEKREKADKTNKTKRDKKMRELRRNLRQAQKTALELEGKLKECTCESKYMIDEIRNKYDRRNRQNAKDFALSGNTSTIQSEKEDSKEKSLSRFWALVRLYSKLKANNHYDKKEFAFSVKKMNLESIDNGVSFICRRTRRNGNPESNKNPCRLVINRKIGDGDKFRLTMKKDPDLKRINLVFATDDQLKILRCNLGIYTDPSTAYKHDYQNGKHMFSYATKHPKDEARSILIHFMTERLVNIYNSNGLKETIRLSEHLPFNSEGLHFGLEVKGFGVSGSIVEC